MSEPFAIAGSPSPPLGGMRGASPAAAAELVGAASSLATDAPVEAVVLERTRDGTLLLRSPYGLLSLKTAQNLPPGSRVVLRPGSGSPGSVTVTLIESEPEPASETATGATRPTALPLPAASADPPPEGLTPVRANGWPALDHVLAALDTSAPALSALLRAELEPASGGALAGTLLFALGTLYGGRWPGKAAARALAAAGAGDLHNRLAQDIAELTRLAGDATTGEWQVLALPLLLGGRVQPLRLYLRRPDRKPEAKREAKRFVIEAELSSLGPMQLDGMLRERRLDLVLRSRKSMPEPFRQESAAIFHAACAAQGLAGELVFATAAEFAVAPMAPLIGHVALSI